jgi:hypothetical protein
MLVPPSLEMRIGRREEIEEVQARRDVSPGYCRKEDTSWMVTVMKPFDSAAL